MTTENDDIRKEEPIQNDFYNIVQKTPRVWDRRLEKLEVQVKNSKIYCLKD